MGLIAVNGMGSIRDWLTLKKHRGRHPGGGRDPENQRETDNPNRTKGILSDHQKHNAFELPAGRVSILGCLYGRVMMAKNNNASGLPELTKENFSRLSFEAQSAFIFRASIRLIPLLGGIEGRADAWPSGSERRCLSAIIAATDINLMRAHNGGEYDQALSMGAVQAVLDASKETKDISVVLVGIIYSAVARNAFVAAENAIHSTVSLVVPAGTTSLVKLSMRDDLRMLMDWSDAQRDGVVSNAKVVPLKIVFSPLWVTWPENWGLLIPAWKALMEKYGMFDVFVRYMDLVSGEQWDIDSAASRLTTWYKVLQREEPGNKVFGEGRDYAGEIESDVEGEPVDLEGNNPEKKAQASSTIKTASIANPTGDHATTKDALGREALVKALASFLDHKEYKGQNTIGLLGHWGAGKSSVLHMLEDALSENPENGFDKPKTKYLTATFNAWAYEHTDNIQAGLAQEVVNGLTQGLTGRQRLDLAERYALEVKPVKYLLSLAGLFALWVWVVWVVYHGGLPDAVASVGSGLAVSLLVFWRQTKTVFSHPLASKLQTYLRLPNFGSHIGLLPVIKQQVECLCRLALFPKGKSLGGGRGEKWPGLCERFRRWLVRRDGDDKRLLLMIDDLDRCGEKGIVKTLEAVKLVMDLPNVTTIIAVDHRMALAALSVHYHNLAEKGSERTAHAIARDYLGKIITLPIQLDTPGDAEIGEYLDKVLFVNLEKVDESAAFNPAMSTDENNIGEPAKEAINNQPEGVENVDPIEPADNVEDEAFNAGEGPKQESDEVVALEKEGVLIDEVVKDSKEERDQFAALSKALEITNPRQLKRLHNSYRLLKALGFHQMGSDRGFYGAVRERLLAMIFWMEWVSCLDKKERDKEEAFMRMPAHKEASLDGLKFSKSTYDMIKGMLFPHYAFDESQDSYDGLKERVKVFMLPFSDISNDSDKEKDKK